MTELKRCPFCEGEAAILESPNTAWVQCERGHVRKEITLSPVLMSSSTMEDVRQTLTLAWNTRPIEDKLKEELKEIKGIIKTLFGTYVEKKK